MRFSLVFLFFLCSEQNNYFCIVKWLPWHHPLSFHLPVPPSVPACRIQGALDVGSDIMLLCSSEEGIPTPSYSWEKLDALPRLPPNAMQGITNKLAVGVPFCPTFAGKCHTRSGAKSPVPSSICHVPGPSYNLPKIFPFYWPKSWLMDWCIRFGEWVVCVSGSKNKYFVFKEFLVFLFCPDFCWIPTLPTFADAIGC